MKTEHTPGPWESCEGPPPHHQGQMYSAEEGTAIAISYGDEGGANARLIAAAPELLEALIHLSGEVNKGFMPNNVACAFDLARAAIAKATASYTVTDYGYRPLNPSNYAVLDKPPTPPYP